LFPQESARETRRIPARIPYRSGVPAVTSGDVAGPPAVSGESTAGAPAESSGSKAGAPAVSSGDKPGEPAVSSGDKIGMPAVTPFAAMTTNRDTASTAGAESANTRRIRSERTAESFARALSLTGRALP